MKLRLSLAAIALTAALTALLTGPAAADGTNPDPGVSTPTPSATPDPIYTLNDTYWGN